MFFSWLDGVYGFGEDQRGEALFPSHHIKGTYHQHDLQLLRLTLITWLWCWLPGFSLSVLYSSEGSHHVQPIVKEWGVMLYFLREEYLHKLFGILLHKIFVSSPPLLIYSMIYFMSVWLHEYLFCNLGYSPVVLILYSFCCWDCFNFAHWGLFQLAPAPVRGTCKDHVVLCSVLARGLGGLSQDSRGCEVPESWMHSRGLWVTPCSNWKVLYILKYKSDMTNSVLEGYFGSSMNCIVSLSIHLTNAYGNYSTTRWGVRVDHDGERILTFTEHLPAWYLVLYTLDFIRFSQQPNETDTLFNILQIRTLFQRG